MRLRLWLCGLCALALLAACGPVPRTAPSKHKAHASHHTQATGPVQTPPSILPPSGNTPPGPVWTPPVPQGTTSVNGCNPTTMDPAAPFGGCLDGALPQFSCCSAAEVGWSGIYAGMALEMKGAVPLDADGKPQSTAVLIIDPAGRKTEIPVRPNGAFDQSYAFQAVGTYQIGVLYRGTPADLVNFQVGWRYKVLTGSTLEGLFPQQREIWPKDDLFLAAQAGQPSVWTLQVENAQGVPQPGAAVTPNGPVAGANGVVTVTLPAPQGLNMPGEIAPGLFFQVYEDIMPSGDTLTGYPPPGPRADVAPGPVSILIGGVRYYDVQDFFALGDAGFQFGGPGMPPAFADHAAMGAFSLFDGANDSSARILANSGVLQNGEYSSPNSATWTDIGTVHAIAQNGQVYATLEDMVTIARAIGWAAPDGKGGVLFSDSWLP